MEGKKMLSKNIKKLRKRMAITSLKKIIRELSNIDPYKENFKTPGILINPGIQFYDVKNLLERNGIIFLDYSTDGKKEIFVPIKYVYSIGTNGKKERGVKTQDLISLIENNPILQQLRIGNLIKVGNLKSYDKEFFLHFTYQPDL